MKINPSPFLNVANIEYFLFEEDFMENNIRCIPMIVRFKMDECCIKLKLSEWSKFNVEERIKLATMYFEKEEEILAYKNFLMGLIQKYTTNQPTVMSYNASPDWANTNSIEVKLKEKLEAMNIDININQWKALTNLQRFALIKLCKSNHENKNLPKALKEFSLR